MSFRDLGEALRRYTLQQISLGNTTQSRLAELSGFRQSHISNFLNGHRALSLEGLDRLLTSQSLNIATLLGPQVELDASEAAAESQVPVTTPSELLRRRPQPEAAYYVTIPASSQLTAPRSRRELSRFAAIQLTPELAHGMPALPNGAVAIIDRHDASLASAQTAPHTFAVNTRAGLRFRYLQRLGDRIFLRPADTSAALEAQPAARLDTLVIGRLCWLQQPL